MKIIFSPTKEFNLDNKINKNWNISDYTQNIINILKKLSDKELKDNLKINDSILNKVKEYISDFDTNKSYEALYMYNGLSFRNLEASSLKDESIDYLNKNLIILSTLYGPISPNTRIKPYRLDFQSRLKIYNQSLNKYWKTPFNDAFSERETILNLASDEFSGLLYRNKFNFIDFKFYEYDSKNDKLKSHSTISKKARGLMLRYLAYNKIEDLNLIKNFEYDNYEYSNESSPNNYIFIKNI